MEDNGISGGPLSGKSEYKKCILDGSGRYMAENFMTLPGEDGPGIRLTDRQRMLMDSIGHYGTFAVVKGRGCGFTTLIKLRMAYEIAVSDGCEKFAVYSFSQAASRKIIGDVVSIVEGIPARLWTVEPGRAGRITVARDSMTATFSNGCKVAAVQAPDDVSKLFNDGAKEVYMDEWLFAENAGEMLDEFKRVLGGSARFIMGSSPNNVKDLGYDTLEDISAGRGGFPEDAGIFHMGPADMLYSAGRPVGDMTEQERDEYYGIVSKKLIFGGFDYGEGYGCSGE